MRENKLLKIYKSKQTVFNANELSLLLNEPNLKNLKSCLNYFVKKGYLINPRRGIYTKDQNYSLYELGNKIFIPSYVSLETILAKNGVIFQYDARIFLVSYLSRQIEIKTQKFVYSKIKDQILFSPEGVVFKEGYSQATLERAFLDKIYLNPNFYFDNLAPINWEKAFNLAPIYNNKKLIQNLNFYKNA